MISFGRKTDVHKTSLAASGLAANVVWEDTALWPRPDLPGRTALFVETEMALLSTGTISSSKSCGGQRRQGRRLEWTP
jgi:hypothetical protein